MAKERPITVRPPFEEIPTFQRAIVSPCTGCKNQYPVPNEGLSWEEYKAMVPEGYRPCPKEFLYSQKRAANGAESGDTNWNHPIYNENLRGINPVWPGIKIGSEELGNSYGYVFLATFEENVDDGWNIEWDTAKIRCRGPFLIAFPERYWNYFGRLEQSDTVLAMISYYYIDGAQFQGYAMPSATSSVATGYNRKIDSNLGKILSGTPRGLF